MNALKFKIFVINMPKSKERWEYVKSQIEKLGCVCARSDGIDVSALGKKELDKYYSCEKNRKTYPKPLTKGEIGCHIAHIKCWEKIVSEDLDFAVILEDDIFIDGKFPRAIDFIKEHFNKWDFIRLQVETKKRLLYNKDDFGEFSICEFIRISGGLWGYALNKKTAQTLLSNILPFGITADSNMHTYHKFNIDVKTLLPPVVFARRNNDSDIELFGKRKKQRNFYPFARQVFSISSYFGRICRLVKRDGIKKFILKITKIRKV